MSTPVQLSRVGLDDDGDRALFLVAADQSDDLPENAMSPDSRFFVSLIAWDSQTQSTFELARVARMLLNAGCVYFCCWGPGCERMHDVVDAEYLRAGVSVNDDESTIMTTWHDSESLDEAAWFALNTANPDDRFFAECKAVVAVCIGNRSWAKQLATAFADPRALSSRVVGAGDDVA